MDPVELLQRMVAIESLSGAERELADFLVGAMTGLGLDAHVDEAGNAVGVKRGPAAPDGREQSVVLLGHMDTVPGRIPVRIEDGVLHGRGAVDAKGPLATFVQAVARNEPPPGTTWIVIGAVEEETASSKGARHVAPRYRPDLCLIGEPSGWDALTLGYKGCLRLELTVTQPCGHGAGPESAVAERGVALWNAIRARADAFNAGRERLFEQLLPTLSAFHTDTDGLHESARLRIGFRLPPEFDAAAFRAELAELAPDAELASSAASEARLLQRAAISCASSRGPSRKLHFDGEEPAWSVPRSTPLARAFQRSLRRHGVAATFKHKTGTSDMNVLGPAWGCPIAAYGPGDSTLDHTPTERLELAEYERAIDVLGGALRELAGADTTSPGRAPRDPAL